MLDHEHTNNQFTAPAESECVYLAPRVPVLLSPTVEVFNLADKNDAAEKPGLYSLMTRVKRDRPSEAAIDTAAYWRLRRCMPKRIEACEGFLDAWYVVEAFDAYEAAQTVFDWYLKFGVDLVSAMVGTGHDADIVFVTEQHCLFVPEELQPANPA